MLILDSLNIKKNFGDREILSFDQLKIRSGDKIGVVGQNGAGKTTLLNILAGELLPDEGIVKRFCEAAYIKQFSDEEIVADAKVLSEFAVQDKIKSVKVSGGEQTRLKIASALSKNSLLLFADEPTANLDFKGILLLKNKLSKAESLVLISHDRDLLDSICNKIIEVSNGRITFYEGNFSFYQQQKQKMVNREWFEYENYVDEKKHLEEAIVNRKARAKAIKKTPTRMGNSEARLHKRNSNEMQEKIHDAAKSINTRLEKLEIKNKPKELSSIKLDFSLTNPPHNKIVISSDDLSFCYDRREIFANAKFQVYKGRKQAIIGENGVGKTTLLNQIYSNFEQNNLGELKGQNVDGLDINSVLSEKRINVVPKAVLGYFCQGFENLDLQKNVLENVMQESVQSETTARTILARLILSGENVYKKVGVLSGGERIKVSFAKLFVSSANVLLLDEPTNYLDIASIEALQNILCEYEGTVLFVSHDKAFVNAVAQRLLVVKNKKILEFDGNLKAFEARHNISKIQESSQTQKIILQMRMTEVLSKLSQTNSDNEELEAEYQELISQMKFLQLSQ
ncbi:MAG TPA: ABC-F family ATP-binding cassette domain-containing protein [Ruminiclostridium sp.]